MTNADRKYRSQRTTALTFGLMAEVAMGGTLLVWSTSPSAAERAVFGPGGSNTAVASAMVLIAVGMLVIMLAARLGRTVLMATVAVVSLASACVGVIAITTLLTDPGLGFLLMWGWVLTIPVTLTITRASALPGRTPQPEEGRT